LASLWVMLVVLGLGAAATPPAIVVELTLLASRRGLAKASVFAAGLTTAVATSGAAAWVLFGRIDLSHQSMGPTWPNILGCSVGAMLIAGGVWVWRRPPSARRGLAERALDTVDEMKLRYAFVLGAGLVNLVPGFAAVTEILKAEPANAALGLAETAVFLVVATSSVTAPILLRAAAPRRWAAWSERLRGLATTRGDAILGAVLTIVGAFMVIESAAAILR
jgi:hypothetical protein